MAKILGEFLPLFAMLGVYLYGALRLIGKRSYDPVGPYRYPIFLATVAIALAAVLLIRDLRKGGQQVKAQINKEYLPRAALIAAVSVIYLALMKTVGYLFLTPFYIGAMLVILGRRNWKSVVLTAVLTTAILYLPFRYVFHVLFPAGLLDLF